MPRGGPPPLILAVAGGPEASGKPLPPSGGDGLPAGLGGVGACGGWSVLVFGGRVLGGGPYPLSGSPFWGEQAGVVWACRQDIH